MRTWSRGCGVGGRATRTRVSGDPQEHDSQHQDSVHDQLVFREHHGRSSCWDARTRNGQATRVADRDEVQLCRSFFSDFRSKAPGGRRVTCQPPLPRFSPFSINSAPCSRPPPIIGPSPSSQLCFRSSAAPASSLLALGSALRRRRLTWGRGTMSAAQLHVVKRDGSVARCQFDKIAARVTGLARGLSEHVDPVRARDARTASPADAGDTRVARTALRRSPASRKIV